MAKKVPITKTYVYWSNILKESWVSHKRETEYWALAMKEIHVEREEVAFMCHTVGTQPAANPHSHLGCKHVPPWGERIFLNLRKHRTRVATLKPDSQYSESYLASVRHLVIPSSWVCRRYPPPLEFLQRQPTWQVLGRLEEDFIFWSRVVVSGTVLGGWNILPMGISELPTWVTRDAGPRVLADSAAGLPAKKLRHRTSAFCTRLKWGVLRSII